jgi:hypothetical protein
MFYWNWSPGLKPTKFIQKADSILPNDKFPGKRKKNSFV